MNKQERMQVLPKIAADLRKDAQAIQEWVYNLHPAEKQSWVIFTGTGDYWVYVNTDAIMREVIPSELKGATTFALQASAERFAKHISDGNGCIGQVCTVADAAAHEVAQYLKAAQEMENLI